MRDLSCVINLFTKYACVKPLNIKKVARIVFHGFTAIENETKPKLNKIWVAHGRKFYKKLMQKGLDKTDVLRYLAHGEGKSVIVERLIKTLKCKIKKWQLKIAKLILVIWINQ